MPTTKPRFILTLDPAVAEVLAADAAKEGLRPSAFMARLVAEHAAPALPGLSRKRQAKPASPKPSKKPRAARGKSQPRKEKTNA